MRKFISVIFYLKVTLRNRSWGIKLKRVVHNINPDRLCAHFLPESSKRTIWWIKILYYFFLAISHYTSHQILFINLGVVLR